MMNPSPSPPTFADALGSSAGLPAAGTADDSLRPTFGGPELNDGWLDGPFPPVPGYEIEAALGRGGMGVVWRARQTALGRRVALKMILAGAYADAEERARFRAEAEAVARLSHPNIVQIHDVGEFEGRPYFSLELVEGGSLAERLHGRPQPPKEAAAVVRTLALAIAHAHERGVIHRDLKPANILLAVSRDAQRSAADAEPLGSASRLTAAIPKIADFGLAKRLDLDSGQTRTGMILGTPEYMAPEQAAGKMKEVGPLADQYALGAILYELLTGRPPHRGATPMDTILQVLWLEPLPPSRLTPKLPRDLETICLKSLAKEPARRYPSAQALADDLDRFLKGEPIRARPASALEHAAKWVRRRPAVAALSAALLLLAVGSFVWIALLYLQSEGHRRDADKNASDATAQKLEAEANLRTASDVVERILTRLADEKLRNLPQMVGVRRFILQEALRHQESLAEQNAKDPALRRATALALTRLGDILRELGRSEEAAAAYLKSDAYFEELIREKPDDLELRRLANTSRHNRAISLIQDGKLAEGRQLFESNLVRARDLLQRDPTNSLLQLDLANALCSVANLRRDEGKIEQTEAAYRESLRIKEKLSAEFSDIRAYQRESGRGQAMLAHLLHNTGKAAEADTLLKKALASTRPLTELKDAEVEDRWHLAFILECLGCIRQKAGDPAAALPLWREGLAVAVKLEQDFPGIREHRAMLALLRLHVGLAEADAGKAAPAEELLRASAAGYAVLTAEAPLMPNYRDKRHLALDRLGEVLEQQNRPAEALAQYRLLEASLQSALEAKVKVPDAERFLPYSWFRMADQHERLGQAAQALPLHRQAEARLTELAEKPDAAKKVHINLAYASHRVAMIEWGAKAPNAEASFRRARGYSLRLLRQPSPTSYDFSQHGAVCNNFGQMLGGENRLDEARELFHEAVEHQAPALAMNPADPLCRKFLSIHLQYLGTYHVVRKEAELDREYAALRDAAQAFRPEGAVSAATLALLLAGAPEPRVRQAGLIETLSALATEKDPKLASGWHALGAARLLLDKPADALPVLTQAQRLSPQDPAIGFRLALAHLKLKQTEQARQAFAVAEAFVEKGAKLTPADQRLRQEAAKALPPPA